jgi:hypothetical protein
MDDPFGKGRQESQEARCAQYEPSQYAPQGPDPQKTAHAFISVGSADTF